MSILHETSSYLFSEPPCSEDGKLGTLLEGLTQINFKDVSAYGGRFDVSGLEGRASLSVALDLERPGRLVAVLDLIEISRRFRRMGVAQQFLRSLATIFRAQPLFSSLKVERVGTTYPAMAALCRKEGMTSVDSDDSAFCLVF